MNYPRKKAWYADMATQSAKRASTPEEAAKHLTIAWQTKIQSLTDVWQKLSALEHFYSDASTLVDPRFGETASEIAQLTRNLHQLAGIRKPDGKIFIASGENAAGDPWYALKSVDPRPEMGDAADLSPLVGSERVKGSYGITIGRTNLLASAGDPSPLDLSARRARVAQIPLSVTSHEHGDDPSELPFIGSMIIGKRAVDAWVLERADRGAEVVFAISAAKALDL